MALIKYSIGGKITSVEDSDSIEQREAALEIQNDSGAKLVVCKKCGLQHMISVDNKNICSCGALLQLN